MPELRFDKLDEPPTRTGDIKKTQIKKKLNELGSPVDSLVLGHFDHIGEYTAKRSRSAETDLYKHVGAFYRPNYERGLLIYSLIKHYKIKTYLEIGFGRGYSCLCAAMAFSELGEGHITTVDPALTQNYVDGLAKLYPADWFKRIEIKNTNSDDFFKSEECKDEYDMIYIDGDHRYEFVKRDWENSKNRYNKILLFDDYHLPGKVQKDISVSNLIDSIQDESKELIIMDRRIFLDDRGYKDDEIDYGQVLFVK